MSIVTRPCTRVAAIVAALCLAGQASRAQVAPVQYWIPSGLFGFGSSWTDAGGAAAYGNFPGFGSGAARDDLSGNDFRTGLFVSSATGGVGLNGLGRAGAFSNFGALSYQSTLTGYTFKGAGNLPVTVYAGFDTLNYRPGIGSPLAPFSSDTSFAAGTAVRAGIAFQPVPNVSLSFEAGFIQQQSSDGDINARLLPQGRR